MSMLQFSGSTGSYITVSKISAYDVTQDFTIEAWVHPNGSSTQNIMGRWGSAGAGNAAWGLRLVDYQPNFLIHNGSTSHSTTASTRIYDLSHVACVLRSTTMEIWINGVLAATQPTSAKPQASNYDLWFGAEYSKTLNRYAGALGEVRFWAYARTPEEIAANYNRRLTGTESGLLGYWILNGDLMDSSPFQNHGWASSTLTWAAENPPLINLPSYLFRLDQDLVVPDGQGGWEVIGQMPPTKELFEEKGLSSIDPTQITESVDLLTYMPEENAAERVLNVLATPKSRVVYPTGNLPLASVEAVDGFSLSSEGDVRVLLSRDSGSTWITWGEVQSFGETFTSNTSDQWDMIGDATWTYDTTEGALTAIGGDQAVFVHKEYLSADVDLRVEISTAHDGGLLARFQDNDNYYMLALRDDSGANASSNLDLYKKQNGVFTEIKYANVTWPRGTKKSIRWVITGSQHSVYFDGTLIFSVQDSTFLNAGRIGLRNNLSGKTMIVHSLHDVTMGWTEINAANLEDVGTRAMTADMLATLSAEQWAELIGDADPIRLRFAYYLADASSEVDALAGTFDMKGIWQSAIPGQDWRYTLAHNDQLKVRLLRDGDYKINY